MTDTQVQSPREMIARYVAARLRPWSSEAEAFTPDNPMYYESCIWADDILQLILSQELGDVVSKETFNGACQQIRETHVQVIHNINKELDKVRQQLVVVEEERDQAIAHDRQPYPTAWAYEQACRTMQRYRTFQEEAEANLRSAYDRIRKLADDAHDDWQSNVNGHAAAEHKKYRDQLLQILVDSDSES